MIIAPLRQRILRAVNVARSIAQHMRCGLRGHNAILRFENARLSLRCPTCGHETPGWTLRDPTPRIETQGNVMDNG